MTPTRTSIIALIATAAMLNGAMPLAAADGVLKQAKLIIEHNATDLDTGFQAFLDADGWESLEIVGPDGVVAEFRGQGVVGQLGMTELFLETTEPENAKMPIEELLAMFPEGIYEFHGKASELGGSSGMLVGSAELTHVIPAGVTLAEPASDAVLPHGDITVRWEPSDTAIDGSTIDIVAYQLIVEKDEEPHPAMIGKRGLSMYLPATTTELTLPAAVFEPGTKYLWEVLAIEAGGNQTLQSSAFAIE